MRRLRDIEEGDRREVESFYAQHPEFKDVRDRPERHQAEGEEHETLPVDPIEFDWTRAVPLFPEGGTPEHERNVTAAFQQMREQDVWVLERRYLERMTLDAIGAELGVTRQAVLKRLAVAVAAFKGVYRGADD